MNTRLKWIDAGKIIKDDPTAKVLCPNCEKQFLKIRDEISPDGQHIDRYIVCENCNSYNVLTFKA